MREGTLEALMSHTAWLGCNQGAHGQDKDENEDPLYEMKIHQLSLWFALMSFAMLFDETLITEKFLQSDLKNVSFDLLR